MGVRMVPYTGPSKPIKINPLPNVDGPDTKAPAPQPGDLKSKSGGWSG